MNVLLQRGTPSPKRIRGTFLRHEPTRRTSFYAAMRFVRVGVHGEWCMTSSDRFIGLAA
jgi:hypothetical protein